MLVRGFVVVEEGADARLLLVFGDLFSEDFQFKLHEVDLLLQVDDVLVCRIVFVGVATEGFARAAFLLLTVELHHVGIRVVTSAVAEWSST